MNARPRGRRDPALEVPVPPECREMIRRGALVSVSTSGGKDSQAMGILLARIVPRDQLVAVHAPLGEVEWPGTVEHIESTSPAGLPLIMAETASGKSLLDRVEERGKWLCQVNRIHSEISVNCRCRLRQFQGLSLVEKCRKQPTIS